jgi:hypothetical protein
MSAATADTIESYAAGADRLAEAVAGWSGADLRRIPPSTVGPEVGKWSVHELVIHLADADLSFADRMRRVIAMDSPALLAWHEGAYLQRLHYEDQSHVDAVELIRLTRRQMTRILQKLPASDFERIGIHDQRGPQKLSAIITFADWHLKHHLEFLEKKRSFFLENRLTG